MATRQHDVLAAIRDALTAGRPGRAQALSDIEALVTRLDTEGRDLLHRSLTLAETTRRNIQVMMEAVARHDLSAAKAAKRHMEIAWHEADDGDQGLFAQLRARAVDVDRTFQLPELTRLMRKAVAQFHMATALTDADVSQQIKDFLVSIGPDQSQYAHHWAGILKTIRGVVESHEYGCDEETLTEYVRVVVARTVIEKDPQHLQSHDDLAKLEHAGNLFFNRHVMFRDAYAIVHTPTSHAVVLRSVIDRLVLEGYVSEDVKTTRDGIAGYVSTDADMARALENGIGACDFCSSDFVARVFPATSFEMDPGHRSTGGWAACTHCAQLIVRRDEEALAQRCINKLIRQRQQSPLARIRALANGDADVMERALRDVHAKFWRALVADTPEVRQPDDYAPGINDLGDRILAGVRRGPLSESASAAFWADVNTFVSRAGRHEFSRARVLEIKDALEVATRRAFKERDDLRGEIDRLDAVIAAYHVGPAHIEAMEQQWRAYKVNQLLWAKTPPHERGIGALHQATIETLRQAETYCWSPDTTQAVAAVGAGIPGDCAMNATALGELAAPGRAGWWWLQEPVPAKTTNKPGDVAPIVALLWRRETPKDAPMRLWMSTFIVEMGRLDGRLQSVPIPTVAWYWDDDVTLADLPGTLERGFTGAYVNANGETMQTKTGYEAATMHETIESAMWFSRFFLAASMWLRQRIVVETHGHESIRGPAKRLQREYDLPERPRVRVIELRRAEQQMMARAQAAGAIAGTGRKLSVRFVVGGLFGHTRNQWFPSTQTHAPKWIAPYIKGPQDAPFKTGASVYVVRR